MPPEAADADAYIQLCVDEILPEVDEWGLATHADVFCERGAFDVEQSRRYLQKARELGLELRLHGDQFSEIGAIPLAVELAARSVDHLEATGPEGVAALAASDVIGVMLPAASLMLDRPMPPARALIDAGAAVALATDFNPGSSFCESLPLVMALACARMHLTPAEALSACTINASARARPGRSRRAPATRLPGRHRPARRTRLALPLLPPRQPARQARLLRR